MIRHIIYSALMIFCLNQISYAMPLDFGTSSKDLPIIIEADNGLEWVRDERLYIARGNAIAKKGDLSIRADVLKATYAEESSQTDNQIESVEAIGNVNIRSQTHQGFSDHAVYDVASGIIRLTGDTLRLQTETDVLTARDYIQYNEHNRIAVAVGDTKIIRADKTLSSDKVTAYFEENSQGELEVTNIKATDNVVITTPTEKVTSKHATYSVKTGLAVLTDDVTIIREDTRLKGQAAEVNLKTGVSRLLTKEGSNQRVRGVFKPPPKTQ